MNDTEILRRARAIRTARSVLRRKERLAEIEARCAQGDMLWPQQRFAVLYADPAWQHRIWGEGGKEKAPEAHYKVMSIEEIRALDVPGISADPSVMFMWTTREHLAEAIDMLRHWGFRYVSNLVWHKNTMGLGRWSRDRHELLLVGVKGDMPPPALGQAVDSVIQADTGAHSEKPLIFREIIDRYFPGLQKVELFARGTAPAGWTFWGNEAVNP
jgi:N6-adenosine-specific RNA methylase IME4